MQEHDPYSGDYGLGFFGSALNIGAYVVDDSPVLGQLCYLCELSPDAVTAPRGGGVGGGGGGGHTVTPKDPFHARLYISSLGLHVFCQVGTFKTATVNAAAKTLTLDFDPVPSEMPFVTRRFLVEDAAGDRRPAHSFAVQGGGSRLQGAYELPATTLSATITWA